MNCSPSSSCWRNARCDGRPSMPRIVVTPLAANNSVQRFAGVPNLILTPHVAGITDESNTRVSNLTADNVLRALDKLADNALSLSGPRDEVTLALEARPDGFAFAVRNTGSRLPDELRERLFDSLVSLRDKRGETPHLGLGLYIVRLVAAAHGGSVTARNLPEDEGVEFRIHLPRSPGQRIP